LQEQSADVVVVSSSANESARLLLNSKSRLFPDGLGNRYDWVGRNLHGHAWAGARGLFDFELYDDLGPGCGFGICDFNHGNQGLIGGGLLSNEMVRLPYQFVEGWRGPGGPAGGRAGQHVTCPWDRSSLAVEG